MAAVSDWQQALLEASSTVLQNIFNFLPSLLAALVVFVVGLLLAKWARKLTVSLLKGIKLDALSEKVGLEKFLEKAEIKIKIEEILGNVVKWVIIFVFFITTVNILGLQSVSAILNSVLAAIPRILSAAFVFTAGVLLAGVVESLVKGAVGQLDIKIGRMSGKFASWLVVIFATLAAINELGIAQSLINILFIGVVAMLSLGFGLAIGLGAKDLVSRILQEWYENLRKEIKKR
jgi:hypothetical protein